MPRPRKPVDPLEFRPAAVDPKRSLEEAWEPSLLVGERAQELTLDSDELTADDGPGAEGIREDNSPGSAALASRFEALPIEWITGEPAIETLRFELSDGLRYVGELADDEDDTSDDESEFVDDDERSDLEGDGLARGPLGDEDAYSTDTDAIRDPADLDEQGATAPDIADELPKDDSAALETPAATDDEPALAGISEEAYLGALDAARQEALKQGIEQGLAQGLREGMERGLEEGVARGREEARQQFEAEFSERLRDLDELLASVKLAGSDSHRLFAPMKKLALHLAEQLVRGELSLSGDAINRLVEHALVEVDRSSGNDLVVSLNPEDVERWTRCAPAAFDALVVRADPSLSIGSVRVTAGESIIEDLIEHRLHQMAARLLGETPARGFSRMTSLRMHAGPAEDISDVG